MPSSGAAGGAGSVVVTATAADVDVVVVATVVGGRFEVAGEAERVGGDPPLHADAPNAAATSTTR
jgi:hypothetical protein